LDIAGYMATLGTPEVAATVLPDEKVIAQGGALVEKLGCVGCHTMPANDKIEEGRVPLRYVRAKWNEGSLRAFLKQPDKHYKWVRMPNFNFSDEEVAKVAAFLLHAKIEEKPWLVEDVKDKPDAARGKALFASSGCANCHTAGANVASALKAPALKIGEALTDSWTKGCMDPKPAKAPDFHLKDSERAALLAFAGNTGAKKSMNADSMPEFAERQLRVLRCVACHQRDDQDDLWSKLEEETASLKVEEAPAEGADGGEAHLVSQARPKLTWIGEKLKPEWMGDFIAGKIPYKFRPWIHARMPGFPQRAHVIARGLAIEHGFKPVTPPEPAPDKEMSDVGKKIVVKEGGFACTGCHGIGKAAAVGVFEAPGPNLMYIKSRLQKSYFMRWMKNPLRVDPDTKMPEFAPGDTNQLTQFYEGQTAKQFEAIWQYLLAGEAIEAPEE
jgi:mono/diheme cytochrome c family protein